MRWLLLLLALPAFAGGFGPHVIGNDDGIYRMNDEVSLSIAATPFTRTVTCTGAITLTGTGGGGAVSWAASPDGASGACTGTGSWSCAVAVSPNAAGEGVETITVSQSGGGSSTVDVGFYVAGAHSCFLAQSINGTYNSGLVDADAVATWVNLGSSALNVTQATGSAQPSYRTAVVGGQPVVRCDGGDRLAATTAADWTYLSNGTDSTVDAVAFTAATAAAQVIAGTSRGTLVTQVGFRFGFSTTFRTQYILSDGASFVLSLLSANNAVSTSKFDLHTLTTAAADTPDFSGYVNGVSVISGTPATYSAAAPFTALQVCSADNGTLGLTGDLFRIMSYSSLLSATSQGINLSVDEWALGGTLPVTP